MKLLITIILFFCSSCIVSAQTDSLALISEVKTKLQNKSASVSEILSEKKYLSIHPATSFRELIKTNSDAAVLKIVTPDEPGKKIRVLGTVSDKDGKPVAGALVYMYQTDAKGWYAANAPHVLQNEGDTRHARLFGYVKTDSKGKFELHTVKPSGYPSSDLPAHIHVHVNAAGYDAFVNEFLFDDDERLVGNVREQSVRNKFLISKPEKTTAPFVQQFSYSITLNKE
jgi:protocatechuate 3,4-dioxygenase beta subunit